MKKDFKILCDQKERYLTVCGKKFSSDIYYRVPRWLFEKLVFSLTEEEEKKSLCTVCVKEFLYLVGGLFKTSYWPFGRHRKTPLRRAGKVETMHSISSARRERIAEGNTMKEGWLIRTSESDEGTFGHLCIDDKHWHMGELPDRDNKSDISRILEGEYYAKYRADGKHGECYELQDVPGRTVIQIHIANYFGDVSEGYISDVLGCMGPGKGRAKVIPTRKGKPISDKKQEMVTNSGKAMKEFLAYMKKADLILHVINPIFNKEEI